MSFARDILDPNNAGITEHEELTQRKSKTVERVLRVHAIVRHSWLISFRFSICVQGPIPEYCRLSP